jgi:hypothetical protein
MIERRHLRKTVLLAEGRVVGPPRHSIEANEVESCPLVRAPRHPAFSQVISWPVIDRHFPGRHFRLGVCQSGP